MRCLKCDEPIDIFIKYCDECAYSIAANFCLLIHCTETCAECRLYCSLHTTHIDNIYSFARLFIRSTQKRLLHAVIVHNIRSVTV